MSSFSFYNFARFPEEKSIITDPQLDMQYTELKTELTFSQKVYDQTFDRYNIKHFTRVKFRGTPYWHKKAIDEVTELHRFVAYVDRHTGLLLIKYGKDVSDEVVSRLKKRLPSSQIKRLTLDLKKLLTKFPTLIGTYFRNIQIPHLKSGALFGKDVNQSDPYDMFDKIGELSSIIAATNYDEEAHTVMISSDYTVRFYKEYPEDFEIAFLMFLKSLLDKHLVAELAEPETPTDAQEHQTTERLTLDL